MKNCFICKYDNIIKGNTNKMFEENGNITIIKNIPCLICANCGELYFETKILVSLEQMLENKENELEIFDYQKQVA